MKLQLPDGTILDAPDDADPKVVVRNYTRAQGIAKLKQENPGEYDTESQAFKDKYGAMSGTGTGQRLLEGAGAGLVNIGRRAANLVTPDADTNIADLVSGAGPRSANPNAFGSREKIAEQEQLDKQLEDTTAGSIGKMGGELAATLPLGMGVGKLLTMAGAGTRLAAASPILSKVLGHGVTKAIAEGAVIGGVAGDPGHRLEGAGEGAAFGGGLTVLGKVGGRLTRGLVKKSQAAEDLELLAANHGDEIDIPIAQAAGDKGIVTRLAKTLYGAGLPNIPTIEGRAAGQVEKALGKAREIALKEAAPDGVTLAKGATDDVLDATKKLKGEFDAGYQEVKDEVFRVPPKLSRGLETYIKAAIPSVDDVSLNRAVSRIDEVVDRFRSGNLVMDGTNILNTKNAISKMIAEEADLPTKTAMQKGLEVIDGIIRSKLKTVGKLKAYDALKEPYSNFKMVRRAALAAKPNQGKFTMNQLARASGEGSEMLHLAQTAGKVLKKNPESTRAGRMMNNMILGTSFALNPVLATAAVAGGHALMSPTVQRGLLGNTGVQKALASALRRHATKLRGAGRFARTLAAQETGD
jgi:hypothetical protein